MPELRNPRVAAETIRHDIGKYATLQQRFLPDDPSEGDLREALIADLGATRRGPSGSQSIVEVWGTLAAEREVLSGDPGLLELEQVIAQLGAALADLPGCGRSELERVAAVAARLPAACRALGRASG